MYYAATEMEARACAAAAGHRGGRRQLGRPGGAVPRPVRQPRHHRDPRRGPRREHVALPRRPDRVRPQRRTAHPDLGELPVRLAQPGTRRPGRTARRDEGGMPRAVLLHRSRTVLGLAVRVRGAGRARLRAHRPLARPGAPRRDVGRARPRAASVRDQPARAVRRRRPTFGVDQARGRSGGGGLRVRAGRARVPRLHHPTCASPRGGVSGSRRPRSPRAAGDRGGTPARRCAGRPRRRKRPGAGPSRERTRTAGRGAVSSRRPAHR